MAENDHAAQSHRADPEEPIAYPANQLISIVDTEAQLDETVAALVADGFADAEVMVSCGPERAAALEASTARRGLARFAARIAETLDIADPEMEIKGRYEQALRDGRYVLRVHAPSPERKERGTEILRDHGGHTVTYHGRFAIEGIAPPTQEG